MSKIITYKGKLPIGVQEKIHLSTNNGLTGYRINKFQIISSTPGVGSVEFVAKIYMTSQTGSESTTVDFSEPDLLAAIFYQDDQNTDKPSSTEIVLDKETFNQDIFIYITSPNGSTVECNFYIELEQFKIDLNTSTFHTLKNIRNSRTQ